MKSFYSIFYLIVCLSLTVNNTTISQTCSAQNEGQFISCLSGGNTTIQVTKSYTVNGDHDLSGISIAMANSKDLVFTGNITINSSTNFSGGGTANVENNSISACANPNANCGDISFTELNNAISSGTYSTLYEALSGLMGFLPVELSYFEGEVKQEMVKLEWITDTEINNDYFEIEYSLDGKEFSSLGIVLGAGTTIERTYYEFEYESNIKGRIYYRLKQVDWDGSETFSDVIILEIDGVEDITIFPTLASDYLKVRSSSLIGDDLTYNIFDYSGRRITSSEVDSFEGELDIDLFNLREGNYVIQLITTNNMISQKFYKQ